MFEIASFIQRNMLLEKIFTIIIEMDFSKWFCTKAIYTSCHDLISKLLMLIVRGMFLLLLSDEVIINAAERNCKDVVPLYYEMKKAKDALIDNSELYNGMIAAYTGGNIGEVSNDISKAWNKSEITEEGCLSCKMFMS